jgi:hypothetical protein
MVGPNGLEPSTSSVSGKRSNQLSYGPACDGCASILRAAGNSGKRVDEHSESRADHGLENSRHSSLTVWKRSSVRMVLDS